MNPQLRSMTLVVGLLAGCGTANQNPIFCTTPCGLAVAAANRRAQFACEDYIAAENAMLRDEAILPHSCEIWKGAIAWELEGHASTLNGRRVAGWTECWNRRFFFHTGDGVFHPQTPEIPRALWQTAFVHEMNHLAQNCESPPPTDEGMDYQHSNWIRDGLMGMSDRVKKEMERR